MTRIYKLTLDDETICRSERYKTCITAGRRLIQAMKTNCRYPETWAKYRDEFEIKCGREFGLHVKRPIEVQVCDDVKWRTLRLAEYPT